MFAGGMHAGTRGFRSSGRGSLMLDGRTDVAAGYSLRRILKSYAGPIVRLRRSSDNAEQDFSSVMSSSWVAWRDANGAASASVTKWYDQSGLGRDLAQATASAQPAFGVLANGLPGMTFDGVDDYLRVSFTLVQPWSFNVVYRRMATETGQRCVFDGFTGGASSLQSFTDGTPDKNWMFAGSIGPSLSTANMPLGTRGAVGGGFNNASSLMESNAATLASGTGTVGTGNPGGLTLGVTADTNTNRSSNMEVQEFLAFNAAHTSTQLKSDNAAMRSAWRF